MNLYGKSWVDLVWKKHEQSIIPSLSQHASCSYGNLMYIHGGQNTENDTVVDDLYSYDCLLGEIKKIEINNSKKPKARYGHTIEYLHDKNALLLFGGITESGKSLNDMWIFKFDNNQWVKAYAYGDSPSPRYGHTFTLTIGTRAIITGGSTNDMMDFYLLNVGNIYYNGYTPDKDDKASFMDYSLDFFNLDIDSSSLELMPSHSRKKLLQNDDKIDKNASSKENKEHNIPTDNEVDEKVIYQTKDSTHTKHKKNRKKNKHCKDDQRPESGKVKSKKKNSSSKIYSSNVEVETKNLNEEIGAHKEETIETETTNKNEQEANYEGTASVADQKVEHDIPFSNDGEEKSHIKNNEKSYIKVFEKRPIETNRRRSQRVYTSIKHTSEESVMKDILSPDFKLSSDLIDSMDTETLKSELKTMVDILNHYHFELSLLTENEESNIDFYRNKIRELKDYHIVNVLKLKSLPQHQPKSSKLENVMNKASLRRSLEISNSAEKELLKMKVKNQSLPEGCEDNESNRKERIQSVLELLESERNYVRDLKILITEFMEPLELKGILPEKDIQTIFSNIKVILSLNQEFLDSLEQMKSLPSEQQTVGGVFLTMADYLKMYTVYCSAQEISVPKVQELLRTDGMFERFIQSKFMSPICRGLDIFSFLIQPIQRICKYPLLLKQIFKCTPSSHHDFEKLYFAITKVEHVVMKINEGKRLIEAQMKMIDIEQTFSWEKKLPAGFEFIDPTRRLIQQGELMSYSNSSYTQCYLILFNDIILIAKMSGSKKIVKKVLPLLGIEVLINNEKEKYRGRSFTISHRKFKFNLVTVSEDERDQWISIINETASHVKSDSSQHMNVYKALMGENYTE